MDSIKWFGVLFGRNVAVFVGFILSFTFTVCMNEIVSVLDCTVEWNLFSTKKLVNEKEGLCFVLLFLAVSLFFGMVRFVYMFATLREGVGLAVGRRDLSKNFFVSLVSVVIFFCILARYGVDPTVHNDLLTGKVSTFLILMAWYFWSQSLFVVFSKLLLVMIGKE